MTDTKTIIRVKVLPRASRNQVVGAEDGVLKVKLTAPPVEGRANKALIQFFAKKLGVAKQDIEILSGERSRVKSVRIHGRSVEEAMGLLIT